jgi:NAD+ synthase (glutamine-hydrolysing)
MKIAMAQLNYRIGDFQGNKIKILNTISEAIKAEAELVVFSELAVTGYYPHDLLERKEFIEKAEETILEIAGYCRNIGVLVGGPAINEGERGKKLFNAAYYLADGEIKDIFYKSLLPTYDVFDEYRHFEPNESFHVLHLGEKRLAVTICEDLWDEQPVYSEFGKNKLYQTSPLTELAPNLPDIIINLSASPFSSNQEGWRKDVLVLKASRYAIPVVYVNQVGAHTELIFDGGSVYINAKGEIVHELKYFCEDFRVIDTENPGNPQTQTQPQIEKIEKIHDALLMGIRDYFGKSGFSKATLGLSGGIDSAVVAVMATRALGPENIRVLLMPSKFSSRHSLEDALQLALKLGIKYDTVPIQDPVDSFLSALVPVFKNLPPDVTEENIQARTRGVLLMALSNKMGYILLNTSNKSECAVGYGTLYGDMNGGLSVLGDLYKTEVYALARFINRDEEIIPQNSITKPPSAELKPGQKDTDSLPEYDLLDKILFHYIELNESPAEISGQGIDPEVVRKVVKMVNVNEFKRFQAPPILRISSKSFGFGRRMPLVAKF